MDRDEKELIEIIKAWYPLFEIDKEAYMMLPDEIILDVRDLARKYNVKIKILKMRRRTNYTFVAWVPRKTDDDEEDDDEDVEIVEKEDDNTIKEMVYEFVKEKKRCKVKDIVNYFSSKGMYVSDDKVREKIRELEKEGKLKYNFKSVTLN
ncbi:MAG: isocitrate dehydrogenase [Sulfolobaceae archaeon]